MNKEEILERLWELTVQSLIGKIEVGDYTSQDLNIARQFLKDHGMSVSDADDSPIADLAEVLPFSKDQTNEDHPRETFG
jgi:hypothetical protein|tara:strand:+ start:99 stop:335 length:237 start_codon:yes stop_codon:yes gene_type:complete